MATKEFIHAMGQIESLNNRVKVLEERLEEIKIDVVDYVDEQASVEYSDNNNPYDKGKIAIAGIILFGILIAIASNLGELILAKTFNN